jgi:hypothetical protein
VNKALILLITIFFMNSQAFAVSVASAKPAAKWQLREKISNVLVKTFRPYACKFEGRTINGRWFQADGTTVSVTAASMQDAAELATTGYRVETPEPGDNPQAGEVIINVEGIRYSVSVINCKPLDQSI